jgi:hypothetical protein
MYEKRVLIGSLFVNLSTKIFGGEIQKNGINDPHNGSPDIINWERNQAYESKGSISSDHHKISPEQVSHYRNLIDSDFPLDQGEAYYFLWQHSKRGISRYSGNELEKEVISNIKRLLIVSLDVVEAGLKVWQSTGEGCCWGKTYMFRSSERKALVMNTFSELERMGLNPENYKIDSEIIRKGNYKYKWWDVPNLEIKKIIRRGLRGVERI